jgi:hypothetical protein
MLREFLEEVVAKHGCQVIDVQGVIGLMDR